MTLDGVCVSHLEQADDVVLFSTSIAGLQAKLNAFHAWCRSRGFMAVNRLKSLIMAFGPYPPLALSILTIGGHRLAWTATYTYVGITFTSTHRYFHSPCLYGPSAYHIARYIFAPHYKTKETKARNIAQGCFAAQAFVGPIPVWDGRMLYQARVDPHLTYGCEVCLDIDPALLLPLERVQHDFFRRLLGLQARSLTVVLHSETGCEPLPHRRLCLALSYLRYLSARPVHSLVYRALRAAFLLCQDGSPSWLSDLCHVIRRLRGPAAPDGIVLHGTWPIPVQSADTALQEVAQSMRLHIQNLLDSSPKLRLLRDRKEKDKSGALIAEVRCTNFLIT